MKIPCCSVGIFFIEFASPCSIWQFPCGQINFSTFIYYFPEMKKILSVSLFFVFILSGCRKNVTDSSELIGSWKLIQVYDKNTGSMMFPPTSHMDIVLTFLDRNAFAGHTLRNSLTDGTYTQNGNEINFQTFSMTKIAEDEWGSSFLTVLHACSLQSSVPCSPSTIDIQGNLMNIHTPLRYDITLKKI